MAVNIIDRYIGKAQIDRGEFQLVGVAALMIASKIEEIYPPQIKDYVYICDYAYSKEKILEKESEILEALEFNLNKS